ncbi:MAG: riboflavin synthase [Chitinophagia bacterium]|nr:riboflavin synthase [Chitinophagia bacterium]
MFTGIIESLATVKQIDRQGTNLVFTFDAPITHELRVDQSVAHNGICLTVTGILGNSYTITAIAETIAKTNIATWQIGDRVNLERALQIGSRLDGHFVQGHIDCTGVCIAIADRNGSRECTFSFPANHAPWVIEKGSIALNGVSLTAFNVTDSSLTVALIPYTIDHTTFAMLKVGDKINIEFDLVGKYITRRARLSVEAP